MCSRAALVGPAQAPQNLARAGQPQASIPARLTQLFHRRSRNQPPQKQQEQQQDKQMYAYSLDGAEFAGQQAANYRLSSGDNLGDELGKRHTHLLHSAAKTAHKTTQHVDTDLDEELAYRDALRQRQIQHASKQLAPQPTHNMHQQVHANLHQQFAAVGQQSQPSLNNAALLTGQSLQPERAERERHSPQERHPPQHVNFGLYQPHEPEQSERKKKYLTAKYGAHQMSLIKKRLKVEMWLHDELQELAAQTVDDADAVEEVSVMLRFCCLDAFKVTCDARRAWKVPLRM